MLVYARDAVVHVSHKHIETRIWKAWKEVDIDENWGTHLSKGLRLPLDTKFYFAVARIMVNCAERDERINVDASGRNKWWDKMTGNKNRCFDESRKCFS